jgi:hypothetical protein
VWVEIWVLYHHVELMTIQDRVIMVIVEPRKKGFEVIQFRRPSSLDAAQAMMRFMTSDGRILDELIEKSPSVFVPASGKR